MGSVSSGPDAAPFSPVDHAAWRARVEKELGDRGVFSDLQTVLPGGVELEPLYDRAAWDGAGDPGGMPGIFPYRRGGRACAPELGLPWALTVRAEDADLGRLGPALLEDLAGGATGVWVGFDRAARLGEDPAGAQAAQAAVDGAPLHGLGDLDLAFAEVRPELVSWFLAAGGNAAPATALFEAWLQERGVDPAEVRLHVGADPLGALARDGALPRSVPAHLQELADLVLRAEERGPRWRAVRASGRPYLEAGATPVTAMGLALATAVEYLRSARRAGVSPEAFTRRLELEVAVDRDLFTELAGLRALRLAWSKVMSAAGVGGTGSPPVYVHAVVADRGLTRNDPWVNFLRGTTGTLAAILGGADAVTTPPFDRPLGAPSALGRRVARNTQNILGEESHLGRVADPAGGSHAVEALTDQIGRLAWGVLQEVEAAGGMAAAIASGWVGVRVARERDERRRLLGAGVLPLLGVGVYPNPEERTPDRAPRWTDDDRDRAARRAADARAAGDRRLFDGAPGDDAPPARLDAPFVPVADEDLWADATAVDPDPRDTPEVNR